MKENRDIPDSRVQGATRRPRPGRGEGWGEGRSRLPGINPSPGLRPTSPRGGEVKENRDIPESGAEGRDSSPSPRPRRGLG